MQRITEELQVFVRRFGLLNASCCESCCGEKVSLVQSHILVAIRRIGSPAIQQVATELGIDITTFSRQIKRLEGKGLIARRPWPKDRRVSILDLTEEGTRVLEQIDRFMDGKLNAIFAAMSPFEQHVVARSLEVLNEAMARTGCCTGSPE